MDMNGDRFPDVLSYGCLQYTTMLGGLEASRKSLGVGNALRGTDGDGQNFGLGGTVAKMSANAEGRIDIVAPGFGSDTSGQVGLMECEYRSVRQLERQRV